MCMICWLYRQRNKVTYLARGSGSVPSYCQVACIPDTHMLIVLHIELKIQQPLVQLCPDAECILF
jgi:hypothetical protein